MPQPARKPAATKPAAKKNTAAVRARREVRAEKNKPAPLTVTFRGGAFDIPVDRLGSARVWLRLQHLQKYPSEQAAIGVLFELLGPLDSARFIDLCQPGDGIAAVFNEFMATINKGANVPNS